MARSREITGLFIVTLLAMGVVGTQDATWKDCELGARNPDRSIAACSKILKRSSNAAAFHHRALAFEAKGKLDQAISDVSAGIRLDPQSAYRWQKRGELYARQGKYKQAVADLTEAIRKDPTPRAFRFEQRAEAYKGLGDLAHAIADYDEAIRLDPVAPAYRFRARANALRDAGQYDRALADYETALKLEPTNVRALVDRGRTYARMKRSETAKSDFDRALTLDPSNAELRHAIEVEVAALPRPSPPSTAQRPPLQSTPPQKPAPAQSSIVPVVHPRILKATSIPIAVANNKKELMQGVMNEFYGSYSKEQSCWISKHEGTSYCMNPARIDIVGSEANKRILIAVSGSKLGEDGQPEWCHACPGALGLIVLAEVGPQFGVVAKNNLFEEIGSWGSAPGPEAFSVRELGPHGSYGWLIKVDYTGGGEEFGYVHIYGVVGDGVVSLGAVITHYDNSGTDCGQRGRPRCTDISGDLVIDANSPADAFYPLVLRASGIRQGRQFNGTYRFVFDRHALKFTAPRDMPDELKPF